MTSFVVHGPFEVDFEKRRGGRTLVTDGFWREGRDAYNFAWEKGCYVFAMRNRGLTPIYVGKATKSFKQEVFNKANLHKYHNGFSNYARGTPVMYFAVPQKAMGPANKSHIGLLEDFLIQAGVAKNPGIQNIKGRQEPKWSIQGVVRSSARAKKAEKEFASLFSIQKSSAPKKKGTK
ncbi:MAG TPA: hypothetical protein VF472_26000 [Burkholderiaceae bacterium]